MFDIDTNFILSTLLFGGWITIFLISQLYYYLQGHDWSEPGTVCLSDRKSTYSILRYPYRRTRLEPAIIGLVLMFLYWLISVLTLIVPVLIGIAIAMLIEHQFN